MRIPLVITLALVSLYGHAQTDQDTDGTVWQVQRIGEIHTLAIGEGASTHVRIGGQPAIKLEGSGHGLSVRSTGASGSTDLHIDQIRIESQESTGQYCIQLPGLQLGGGCTPDQP